MAATTAKNLVRRGNMFYFRKLIRGKRVFISLQTSDRAVAAARAKAKFASLEHLESSARWQVLGSVAARRTVCTVGEIFACYELAARARGITSAVQYRSQLINVIRKVHGSGFDAEAAPSTILTPELITDYASREFLAAGADVLAQERAKVTIASTITNARAIFSRWTLANNIYQHLTLPDLTRFRAVGVAWKSESRRYHRPPEALIERTLAAGRSLRQSNPRLYAVFLLCYDLALRAGEASSTRWDWFSERSGGVHLDIHRRADFKPKHGMEREVPLNTETWQELQALRQLPEWHIDGQPSSYVLPCAFPTHRANLVTADFASWMRSIGWDVNTWPKCAHELRKLMGSEWFTRISPQFAQEKLGHTNIAVTCTYYARLSNKPNALPRPSTAPIPPSPAVPFQFTPHTNTIFVQR